MKHKLHKWFEIMLLKIAYFAISRNIQRSIALYYVKSFLCSKTCSFKNILQIFLFIQKKVVYLYQKASVIKHLRKSKLIMVATIIAAKVIGTPGFMDGANVETFFYEEGENYAIDSDGVYHQIADVSSSEELKEYAALGYANEDERFFTNYAEDGKYKNMLHNISEEMKEFLSSKGL
jgi:hypothetical protein